MVTIRAGVPADAAAVARVRRASWFAAYAGIVDSALIDRVTAPDDGAQMRQTFRTRPWQRLLIAEDAGGDPPVVGYASHGPERDVLGAPWPHPLTPAGAAGEIAELYALYVHPGWWSAGIGRALMDSVLAWAGQAGFREITLWVLEKNYRARAFYAKAGFSPDGAANVLHGLGGVTEVRCRRPLP